LRRHVYRDAENDRAGRHPPERLHRHLPKPARY
jgi:hypothetical protein